MGMCILQKNLRCKPTFREAGVRNYREVRIVYTINATRFYLLYVPMIYEYEAFFVISKPNHLA